MARPSSPRPWAHAEPQAQRRVPDSQQGLVTLAVTSGLNPVTPEHFPFLKDNEFLNKHILQKAFCSVSLK